MVNQSVVDYIRREKEKGLSDEAIIKALLDVGWQKNDVDEAINEYWKGKGSRPAIITGDDLSEETDVSKKRLIHKFPFRFKLLFFTIILLIIATVVGLFFVKPNPTRVLSQAFEKTINVESFDYTLDMNLKVELPQNSIYTSTDSYSFSVSSAGSMINGEDGIFKSSQKVSLSVQNLFNAAFDLLTFDNQIYLKVTELPSYGFFDLDYLRDKWIYIDTDDYVEDSQASYTLTEEQEEEVTKYQAENPYIEVREVLDDEIVDGLDTYHFKYQINKENLKLMIIKIDEMQNGETLNDEDKSLINDMLGRVTFYEGDLYVDKKEKLIRQISFAARVRLGESENSEIMTVDGVWGFSDFNSGQEVERPQNAFSVDEVYREYTDKLMEEYEYTLPDNYEYDLPELQIDPQGITLFNELPKVLGFDDSN